MCEKQTLGVIQHVTILEKEDPLKEHSSFTLHIAHF
jgi:hypothetical protein